MESLLEVLPKQGMGRKLCFLRKKSSPFSILIKDLPYPEGQHRGHLPTGCQSTVPQKGSTGGGWGGQG